MTNVRSAGAFRVPAIAAALAMIMALLMAGVFDAPAGAQSDAPKASDDCDDEKPSTASIGDKKPKKKSKKDNADEQEAKPDCTPPPPQVSLANLRSPAPAATDVELQELLTAVDFIDTWYSLTKTHPRLSLVQVSGTTADAARSLLVAELEDLSDTTDTIASLLDVIDDAVAQHKAVEEDIELLNGHLDELDEARRRSLDRLDGLLTDLDMVIRGLQGAAVGLYVSEDQLGASGMDDVAHYNTQQELGVRIEATVDELLALKLGLEADIAGAQARVARLDGEITDRKHERSELTVLAEGIATTIATLTAEVADLTQHQIELEGKLPTTIAEAQAARMLAASPGLGVSLVTLDSYVKAADDVHLYHPSCAIRWELVAGIAKIESAHATHGGAVVGADGDIRGRILGPLLDGSLEGTAVIKDSDGGRLDGNTEFDAAVGPFQFIPSTWSRHALDATGDGFANPHNVYDAALSAASYLCTSSSLADDGGIARSVLSYNHSRKYLADVTGAARDYIVTLALPEAAFDPETLEVTDGWTVGDRSDEFEDIGQIGRPGSVIEDDFQIDLANLQDPRDD